MISKQTSGEWLKQWSKRGILQLPSVEIQHIHHTWPQWQKRGHKEYSEITFADLAQNNGSQPQTLHHSEANATTQNPSRQTRQTRLDAAIDKILEDDDVSPFKKHVSQAANLALSVRSFVGEAVKVSPEASIAWAGVCVVLPLLTSTEVAGQGLREGLVYITSRMRYCVAFQPMIQRLGENPDVDVNLMVDIKNNVTNLYKALLEYQIQAVLHLHKASLRRFAEDVYDPKIWNNRKETIEKLEAAVNKDLEQINEYAKRQQLESLNQTCEQSFQKLESLNKLSGEHIRIMDELRAVSEQQAAYQGEAVQLLQSQAEGEAAKRQRECHRVFRLANRSNDATYEWYKDRVEDSVKGTCQWFLSHATFKHWLEQDSGMLLVSADPGCGKSVLSKRLIDHELPRSSNICYFFFKDQDQNTTLNKALCAVLHQFFNHKPALIKHAMQAFSTDGERLIHNRSSLWKILLEAVHDFEAGTTIIILDALDECVPAEFEELMQRQVNTTQSGCGKIKYLLTTRPYITILEAFKNFPYVRIPGEEHSDDISKEVDLVIVYRANELAKRKELSDSQRDLMVRKLCETPQRTYLWIYLLFDHLKTADFKITDRGILSAIEKLPKNVNQAYEAILNKSKEREKARKVLSIILAARRPLSIAEMNCAINADDVDDNGCLDLEKDTVFAKRLRNWYGLLVSIYHGKVYFLHMTVKEFLHMNASSQCTNDKGKGKLAWHGSISESDAQAILGRCCVAYLEHFHWDTTPRDAHDLSSSSLSKNAGAEDSKIEMDGDRHEKDSDGHGLVDQRNAFSSYAAGNWYDHCRKSRDVATMEFIVKICDPHSMAYLAWAPEYLLDFGAIFRYDSIPTSLTPLIMACLMGLQTVVQYILDRRQGDELEARDGLKSYGFTPLLWAVHEGHEGIIEQLIEKKSQLGGTRQRRFNTTYTRC